MALLAPGENPPGRASRESKAGREKKTSENAPEGEEGEESIVRPTHSENASQTDTESDDPFSSDPSRVRCLAISQGRRFSRFGG